MGGQGRTTIMVSGIKGQDAKREGNMCRSWVGRGDSLVEDLGDFKLKNMGESMIYMDLSSRDEIGKS